jgi:uncharacterized protein YjbI with pentapeptide repeats
VRQVPILQSKKNDWRKTPEGGEVWLEGADFSGWHLSGADLSRAKLAGARLAGVDLRNASLQSADLRSAVAIEAQVDGADFAKA